MLKKIIRWVIIILATVVLFSVALYIYIFNITGRDLYFYADPFTCSSVAECLRLGGKECTTNNQCGTDLTGRKLCLREDTTYPLLKGVCTDSITFKGSWRTLDSTEKGIYIFE